MTKMAIVMRKDLNMRKGKMIAQGGHGVLGVIESQGAFAPSLDRIDWGHNRCTEKDNFLVIPLTPDAKEWFSEQSGFTKICLYCNSDEELMDLYKNAQEAELPVELITDAGRTEFNGVPTHTCIAIGPASADKIDMITGHLPLL